MFLVDDQGRSDDGLRDRWLIAAGDACWRRGDRFETRAGDGDCKGPFKLGDRIEPALTALSEDLVKEDGKERTKTPNAQHRGRREGDSGGGRQVRGGYHAVCQQHGLVARNKVRRSAFASEVAYRINNAVDARDNTGGNCNGTRDRVNQQYERTFISTYNRYEFMFTVAAT